MNEAYTQMDNGIKSGIESWIVAGVDIPQYVFSRRFESYLFFDADMGSSDALITAVQLVARVCVDSGSGATVFSSSDRQMLGGLDLADDWPAEVGKIRRAMYESGDCGGMIIVAQTGKWAIYQNRPVDVGVFAFDGNQSRSVQEAVEDCFFDCKDITHWLSGRSQRDIELTYSLGSDFLAALIKNYA